MTDLGEALRESQDESVRRAKQTRDDYEARCCPACGEEMGDGAYLECDECEHEVTEDEVFTLHGGHLDTALDNRIKKCGYAICEAWAAAHER